MIGEGLRGAIDGRHRPKRVVQEITSKPVRILMCGPRADLPGGMSTVARVLAATANASGRYQVHLVDSGGGGERGMRGYLRFGPALAQAAVRDYDILHLHVAEKGSTLRKGLLAQIARARSIPYVIHLHAAEYDKFLDESSPFIRRLVRAFFVNSQGIVVLGSDWADLLVRELGIPKERLVIVRNGVESVGMRSDEDKSRDRYAVFVGEVSHRKGADIMLDVVEQAQRDGSFGDWRVVFMGTLFDEQIAARAKQLQPTTQAIGSKNGAEKDELIRGASMFVLPSRAEALPMAILEAMSAALPCVVTDVGSISQVVHDGENGVVLEPGNPTQLKAAMTRLMADAQLRTSLGRAAEETWRNGYSAQAMTDGMARVWSDARAAV